MTVVEIGGRKLPFHFGVRTNIALLDKGIKLDEKGAGTYTFLAYLECINQGLIKEGKEPITEDEFEKLIDADFVKSYEALDKAFTKENEKKK